MKMVNLIKTGRIFFAVAIGFFGVQYLIYASGSGGPALCPPWPPGPRLWAYVIGGALVGAGLSIATGKLARASCCSVRDRIAAESTPCLCSSSGGKSARSGAVD